MLNLETVQYDMETLIAHLDELNLRKIVRTQKLTLDFIKNYILNEDYQITSEEQYIDKYYVLQFQPHITFSDLESF